MAVVLTQPLRGLLVSVARPLPLLVGEENPDECPTGEAHARPKEGSAAEAGAKNARSYGVEFAVSGWLATTLHKQHSLAVPLLQRTE